MGSIVSLPPLQALSGLAAVAERKKPSETLRRTGAGRVCIFRLHLDAFVVVVVNVLFDASLQRLKHCRIASKRRTLNGGCRRNFPRWSRRAIALREMLWKKIRGNRSLLPTTTQKFLKRSSTRAVIPATVRRAHGPAMSISLYFLYRLSKKLRDYESSLNKERMSVKVPFKLVAASLLSASVLAACGGWRKREQDETASTNPANTTPSGASQPVQSMQLTGTVAVGPAVANASVTVIDVNGKSVTASANGSGTYTASIAGMSAPFLIVATDPAGNETPLYSVVAAAPASTAPVIANVTTLTTAVAAQLTTSGNPLDLATSGQLAAQVTTSSVNASVARLQTALAPILTANGVTATAFDPIGAAFTANHQGLDAVVDSVSVVPAPSGGMQLISIADPDTAIVLNHDTSVSGALAVPSVAADDLSPLIASLSQCLQGTSAACTSAIDSACLEAGIHSFLSAHPELGAAGVKLGDAKTLASFQPGELTTGSNPTALVRFYYTPRLARPAMY
jgi:hypothetical protein